QAQVLLRKTKELPEHQDGLNNLLASVERATNLIEQLLALARIQNERFPQTPFNLSELCSQVFADLLPKATLKNIEFSADIQEYYEICGHPESIAILIRNIIDNAIKYTPAGGEVKIQLQHDRLEVIDTGVGIRDEDKHRVFDRFVRVDKTRQTGSGLGLAIVHWIAQAHHFEITLHDHEPQGLEVHIHFSRS
ncbi:MAG TPA: two-component sensor histidine kinase, partial [Gammaproteobacteria bacterium]|nr:two-component sensor histidine kinase [Gammaproteobacteria bacterium]